ncbi:alginate lyase family protein [Arenicella xantha]|uniref:Alginate lyase n=1 Tax=Arenicella xantha TaxID=644221 RepID=A0A395JHV2_9GAMM|nr:alginate lyase family protein [Arenicella xantha]RBP49720.1 alginate lyase [Arenicella xantha]
MTHLTSQAGLHSLLKTVTCSLLVLIGASALQVAYAQNVAHPNLTVTQADIEAIRTQLSEVPGAQAALTSLRKKIDAVIALPMDVPVPQDAGGGYTHEQHKRNYQAMYEAGLLFQVTQDTTYLNFVRKMLLAYADLYPTLGIHPKPKEQTPGKLFWQSLNEAMWLVYTIQAYDSVASQLSAEDRTLIETNLLRPAASYLSAGQPQTFNKIHNHGTWAAAAVGMTGYVLNDQTLVKQALYGLDMSGDAGFLQQITQLFSPDGYYAEGPYYQRFALMPFVLFAKAIDVNQPELKIFEYQDQALLKAVRTSIQLSYNKLFFGINDAIKDKGIDTIELVHGIAIAYDITSDPALLAIAQRQNNILLTGYGFRVAQGLDQGLAQPFQYQSMQLRDGQAGDQGALAIFRNGIDHGHQALVMKNTSQGLGHGHFDKLHWLYFDNGNEIVSDYGAARFLNIEAKYGGHYLPENNTWAKQTVAHNTVVVDEQSHFDGDWQVGQKSAPEVRFFAVSDDIQITSASIAQAYPGTNLTRTMAMVKSASLEHPLIVDIFKVTSKSKHQYDLPLHFQGQLISHTISATAHTSKLEPLGKNNGYQYLWARAQGPIKPGMSQVTWLNENRFYTYSVLGGDDQQMIFTQLGANDPNFNLRSESALIRRVKSAKQHTYVSVLETHGEYNGTSEYTKNARSSVVELVASSAAGVDENIDVVTVTLVSGESFSLAVAEDSSSTAEHTLELNGKTFVWTGPYSLLTNTKN